MADKKPGDKANVARVLAWRKQNQQKYRDYMREYMRRARQTKQEGEVSSSDEVRNPVSGE